jgi:hypothetical protein
MKLSIFIEDLPLQSQEILNRPVFVLDILNITEQYWKFWTLLKILNNTEYYWKFWTLLKILNITENSEQILNIT